jgi:hypothetical protein
VKAMWYCQTRLYLAWISARHFACSGTPLGKAVMQNLYERLPDSVRLRLRLTSARGRWHSLCQSVLTHVPHVWKKSLSIQGCKAHQKADEDLFSLTGSNLAATHLMIMRQSPGISCNIHSYSFGTVLVCPDTPSKSMTSHQSPSPQRTALQQCLQMPLELEKHVFVRRTQS